MIFTIGYERRSLAEFIDTLASARVNRVIDVRELPISRRKGFSKKQLSAALSERDIEYVHLRAAGNPFRALKADIETCLRHYAGHVDAHPEVLDELRAAVEGRRAALLCVERDVTQCHRGVLVAQFARRFCISEIEHL